MFLKNDRTLGVKSGMLGTVEVAAGEVLAVRLDPTEGTGPGRLVTIDPSYRSFDHESIRMSGGEVTWPR